MPAVHLNPRAYVGCGISTHHCMRHERCRVFFLTEPQGTNVSTAGKISKLCEWKGVKIMMMNKSSSYKDF